MKPRALLLLATVMLCSACPGEGESIIVDVHGMPDEAARTDEVALDLAIPDAGRRRPEAAPEEELPDLWMEMTEVPEIVEFELAIQPGQPGAPCLDGDDCDSGFCIMTPLGPRCTQTCLEECPFEWSCVQHQASLPDEVFICVPVEMNLCKPCNKNSDCLTNEVETGDMCVPHGAAGSFCGAACMGDEDCPDDYQCKQVLDVWGYETNQCVLVAGECECRPWFVDEGAATACEKQNDHGICPGQRVCTAGGLTPCDALEPAQEACNAKDDNCNGEVDENAGGGVCFVENDFGACMGNYDCDNGKLSCDAPEAVAEQCDGKDNDCDGDVDEGFPDSDGDGNADCLENDKDGDGVLDFQDNCEYHPNPGQEDFDLDMAGDVCDPDDDNDLVADDEDCAPKDPEVKPGAQEACNGKDDDCDGLIDEGYPDSDSDALSDCIDEDDDNDGHPDAGDCEPTQPAIYPGAQEVCDGVDNDCDFDTDESFPDTDEDGKADCVDMDQDGDGVVNQEDNCPKTPNEEQTDSDDDGWGDACDQDLDGDAIPDGLDNCVGWFNPAQKDLDDDGLGDLCDDDVDGDDLLPEEDNCPLVYNPGQEDQDEDDTGDACDDDADGDGDPDDSDCEPENPYVSSLADEECDGYDNNCSGVVDEGFPDWDKDGWKDCVDKDDDDDGDSDITDCEPFNPAVNSQAEEVCNGINDDCDEEVDEDQPVLACGKGVCFHSAESCLDGVVQTCDPMAGAENETCDDLDNDCDGLVDEDLGWTSCGTGLCFHASPNCVGGEPHQCDPLKGAKPEFCDGQDNDCNGAVDDEGSQGCETYYFDADGDGHGEKEGPGKCLCAPTGLYKAVVQDDCNDLNPWTFPGATEMCDGVDNNCDDEADENGATGCSWFYADVDKDGYGAGEPICTCAPLGQGWSMLTGDCDDDASDVHPGALELCDDKDNNCDGQEDETFHLDTDEANCGECGFLCQPDNAFGDCVEGKCLIDECLAGYTDCNEELGDGCEVTTATDVDNCGECKKVCDLDNATEACVNGLCVVGACDEDYADKNEIPEDGCEVFLPGSQDQPVKSCKVLKAQIPLAPDGIYWIDPEEDGGAFEVFCDMTEHGGGWIRVVKSAGNTQIFGQDYTNGVGNLADDNYIMGCSKLAGLGLTAVVVRVNMGIVRDFFKPHSGVSVCQMLSESPGTHHLWSSKPDQDWVQPQYYSGHLGGSKSGWPTADNRQYLSFWGGHGSQAGGCCFLNYDGGGGSWSRAFELFVREE